MAKDSAALRKANVSTARSTADFVVYLQDDIARKDELIRKLKDKNRDLEFAASREVRRLGEEHDEHMKAERGGAGEREGALQARVQHLQEQLQEVLEFKENKSRHDSELDAMRELLEAERKRRQRETAEMQRRMLGLKSDWREARQTEYSAMQVQARGEAQRLLDTDVKRMVLNNKRMEEELTFHKEQAELGRRERAALGSQAKALAREVALFADKASLFAKKAAFRSRENRDLTGKVRALEQSLGEVARDFEAHRRHVAASVSQEGEELVSEVAALRALVGTKNKELSSMKALAEMILSQRTEVEQFLLESLAQVKNELRAQRAADTKTQAMQHLAHSVRGTGGTGTHVPSVRATASAVSASGAATAAAPTQGGADTIPGSGAFNVSVPRGTKGRAARSMVQGRGERAGLTSAGSRALGLGTLPTRMATAPRAVNASTSGGAAARGGGGKVHWHDLSSSQRERVLHLLFAKLNNLPTSKVAAMAQAGGQEQKQASTTYAPAHGEFEMDGPFGLEGGESAPPRYGQRLAFTLPEHTASPSQEAPHTQTRGDGGPPDDAVPVNADGGEGDALGVYMANMSRHGDL
jgi:hypothetical protein